MVPPCLPNSTVALLDLDGVELALSGVAHNGKEALLQLVDGTVVRIHHLTTRVDGAVRLKPHLDDPGRLLK